MARKTTRKAPRTFTFEVTNNDGSLVAGATIEYNRDSGYTAYVDGRYVGSADSKYDAEIIAREAARA